MSLALYRKYRPSRLDEVIGQEHVVEPLSRALDNDKVHHAYLFSGPRGCGKTSSARILARSLNCVTGPTSDPCGECNSCIDLAPEGGGSIDVIELDAATHGLVDDARDLREKAVYAPAVSKYKIYIIDEAHQLGPGAANALLKLVEEPPPHLRFVFATTEPDKIIGTIRSRTHQYNFRLVPARTLQSHLAWICDQEGVQAEDQALSLVARAAGGSVRDSLSILGQLLAGASSQGLTYADAQKQLGVTDAALLDELIQALAAEDGSTLFRLVDTVIQTGHDPRRFVTDVLDRLRDLLIVSQVPDAQEAGLIDGPPELVGELTKQAELFGLPRLVRASDIVNDGLSRLRGATAPKLQLELIMAKLLLAPGVMGQGAAAPTGVASTATGVAAAPTGVAATPASTGAAQPPVVRPAAPVVPTPTSAETAATQATPTPATPAATKRADSVAKPQLPQSSTAPAASSQPTMPGSKPLPKLSDVAPSTRSSQVADSWADSNPQTGNSTKADSGLSSASESRSSTVSSAESPTSSEPATSTEPASNPTESFPDPASDPNSPTSQATTAVAPELSVAQLQALWPSVMDVIKDDSRVAWMMVLDANPVDLAGNMVVLSHPNRGTVKRFGNSDHAQTVAAAISATVGVELRVTMESADAVQAAGASDPASANQAGANPSARTSPDNPASANPSARKDQEQPADLAELEESVADSEDVQELDSIELLVDKLGAKPISSEEG